MTDGEIKSVLPQAIEIERTPSDQKINIVETRIVGSIGHTNTRSVTAVGVRCEYGLDLPDAGLGFSRESGFKPARLSVSVEAAGNPAWVKEEFSDPVERRYDRIKTSEGRCYVDKTSFGEGDLHQGPLGLQCRQ